MTSYYYLDVFMRTESKEEQSVDIYKLKQIITKGVKDLFGQVGIANEVDILKYEEKEGRIILRCFANFYVKLRASLSFCSRQEGKDLIIFATADDHKEPSKVTLPEPEQQAGLILPNGEINWNCPCLGGMATGPCGVEFREAFTCFHKSEADPKGSDCYGAFKEMHLCMAEYPQVYNKYENADDDEDEEALDLKLTDEERALISEDKIKEQASQSEKVSTNSNVESKSAEKNSNTLPEPKKPSTSSSSAGALKINS